MHRLATYLTLACTCALLLACGDDDSGNTTGKQDGGKTNSGKTDAGANLPIDAGDESDCIDIGERFEAPYCVGDYCMDDPELPLDEPLAIAGTGARDVWILQENGVLLHRGCSGWTRVSDAFDVVPNCTVLRHHDRCVEDEDDRACDDDCPASKCPDVCTLIALSPTDAWLEGQGRLWHFDGTAFRQWQDRPEAFDTHLWKVGAAVWITLDAPYTATGDKLTSAYRFEDQHWVSHSDSVLGRLRVSMLAGSGPDDVWAIDPTAIVRWNGTAWSALDAQPEQTLPGRARLVVLARDDAWLLEDSLQHWDGDRWSTDPRQADDLLVGDQAIWLEGSGLDDQQRGRTVIERLDGHNSNSAQIVYPLEAGADTNVQEHVVADSVWIAYGGDEKNVRLESTSTGQWQSQVRKQPALTTLSAMASAGPGELWLLDANGTLMHRGANGYESITMIGDSGDLFARAKDQVWAFGANVFVRWDGTHQQPLPMPSQAILPGAQALWASGPSELWALSTAGVEHLGASGASMFEFAWTTDKRGSAIWGTASNDVWVAGENRSTAPAGVAGGDEGGAWLLHWDGSQWTEHDVPAAATRMYRIAGTGPKDVWLVTSDQLWRWDGSSFGDMTPSDARPLNLVSAGEGALLVCAGQNVWMWNGSKLAPSEVEPAICPDVATTPTDWWLQRSAFVAVDPVLGQRGLWHASK